MVPASDYSSITASPGPAPGNYRWIVNGVPAGSEPAPQLLLLHADDSLLSTTGVPPADAASIQYQPGRWGSAFSFTPGARLTYPREGNLNLGEGTVEMYVALRAPGRDPMCTAKNNVLFQYRAPNGDWTGIVQTAGPNGIVYAGGTVNGNWQSAYGSSSDMRDWQPGEWHHLAFTWSASASRMKMYVDGRLTADTNEGRYVPPLATGATFAVGGDIDGYLIDEVRISGVPLTDDQIRADAVRQSRFADNEIFLSLAGRSPGDRIVLEWTTARGTVCPSAPYVYPVIPITAADPPSTILPPGSSSLSLTIQTPVADSCRFSLDPASSFPHMTPFGSGDGSATHQTMVEGLNPDPAVVNSVFVRCANQPDYALELKYRARGSGNLRFPRKGNLWGSRLVAQKGLEHAAKIDLYLGATFTPDQMRKLRALNPNILILASINTVENWGLPEDYYLHTVEGKRIEVWPGSYRLNLTKPHVAEYQAKLAYQAILDSGLLLDGCFFDNFFTSQSWQNHDIYGNAAVLDADEDGQPDDPAVLDAKWKEGVFHELRTWRKYMPFALNSGHLFRPPDADTMEVFNGDSIGFMLPEVKDGTVAFNQLFDVYNNWFLKGRSPVTMMLESAPPFQIGYGYGYDPLKIIPASTLEFARTYFPYVRFGLAVTLMNDGYFAHEFGDTLHGNDWWYDELDFDLGYPLGPAVRIPVGAVSTLNMMDDGGFEAPLGSTWDLWVNTAAGAQATFSRDTSTSAEGQASVRVDVGNAGQKVDWHIDLHQYSRSLTKGTSYTLSFQAKADAPRTMGVSSSKQSPDWRSYGLGTTVDVGSDWKRYSLTFEATETVSDARVQFYFGSATGTTWLDDVRLIEAQDSVYRRDFDRGAVLLNGSRKSQTVAVGPGYSRLTGSQAARHEYILDDADPSVFTGAGWAAAAYDSGMWKATGPYYHNWGEGCRQCDGATCPGATWDLQVREDDSYTIAAWWPAAPAASTWSRGVVFELVAGGQVLAATTVDQTRDGDQWHTLFTVPLTMASKPVVRIRNQGSGLAIADALWVRSAARYNDGSAAATVTLEPMDGIVLQRATNNPQISSGGVVDAASFSSPIARGSWAAIFGSNLATASRSWTAADFRGNAMPVSLDGTGVMVNGLDAPVSYISPNQVNFQVPAEVDSGLGVVQVQAPSGPSNPQVAQVVDAAPAFFTLTVSGRQYAVAQTVGDAIVLWGSGFGPTTPPVQSGFVLSQPAPLADPSRLQVTIGGKPATILYAGMTIAGVYQINVVVPADLSSGDQPLVATLGTSTSQPGVLIRIQ